MLPSIAVKYLYRKLGRRAVEFKHLHTIYFGSKRILQQEIANVDKKFWKYINTSVHVYDKSNAKDAKKYTESPSLKENQKIIKQSATGDIVVKTETNEDNVVTKVTIEKSTATKPPPKQPVPAPGDYFSILCG